MNILLDTHILLWWLSDDDRLPQRTRDALGEPANQVMVSMASAWELAIKVGLGRLKIPLDALDTQIETNNFRWLAIRMPHIIAYAGLPAHHRDPFDRMLIAQAIAEDLVIATVDAAFPDYAADLL